MDNASTLPSPRFEMLSAYCHLLAFRNGTRYIISKPYACFLAGCDLSKERTMKPKSRSNIGVSIYQPKAVGLSARCPKLINASASSRLSHRTRALLEFSSSKLADNLPLTPWSARLRRESDTQVFGSVILKKERKPPIPRSDAKNFRRVKGAWWSPRSSKPLSARSIGSG